MKTRMQAIDNLWSKLPRVVRDLSGALRQAGPPRDGGPGDRARPEPARGGQGPADPPGAQRRRPRHRDAGGRAGAKGKDPEGTLTLRAYHEGGHVIVEVVRRRRRASTRTASPRSRSQRGLRDPRPAGDDGPPGDPDAGLPAGLLHREDGHERVRPRRRHGRGQDQHRADRRRGRRRVDARRGHHLAADDPADAGDHPGADHRVRRRSGTSSRRSPCTSWCTSTARAAGSIEHAMGAPVYRLRGKLLPLVHLDRDARGRPDHGDAPTATSTSPCCRPRAAGSAWSSTACSTPRRSWSSR